MIKSLLIYNLESHLDERGYFVELLRDDWTKLLKNNQIVQLNLSYSYPGIIRAWHRHLRGQEDYFICIQGSIKICAFDDREDSKTKGELDEFIVSGDKPRIVKIPGILWHGFKVLGVKPATLLYGVNRLYDYKDPDEERRPWNDPRIVPTSINGKTGDPRVGKPWDWNYPPHM
jgi:dTDP-4-dehydrorhamnose 3,5-epimerase